MKPEFIGFTKAEVFRASKILHFLARGRKSTDLLNYRENPPGFSSEKKVSDVLSKLPIVIGVEATQHGDANDRKGVDLFVRIDSQLYLTDRVKVQVKSSRRGLLGFKEKIAKECGLEPDAVDQWLTAHGFILINARREEQKIISDFLGQLSKINKQILERRAKSRSV